MTQYIKHFVKLAIVAFSLVLFVGCTRYVHTTVSAYQSDTPFPTGATFYISPQEETPAGFDQLEFDYYADRLASQLIGRGFKQSDAERADYKVVLQYDNARQQKESNRSRVAFHGGFAHRWRYGSFVVIDGNDYDRFEFARKVRLSISKSNDESEKVVSLFAVSYGRCENLGSVYDEMVTAILDNLYSGNGSVTPMRVPAKQPCVGSR